MNIDQKLEAVESAAWSAAYSATGSAAYSAWSAEKKKQLQMIKGML
jgi:hypothetical protein